MRTWARRATLGLTMLAAGAATARADSQTWNMCTNGSFRSCHSLTVITTPVMTGTTRTGTTVSIRLTNLQGSAGNTDPWSVLNTVAFYRKGPLPPGSSQYVDGWVYGQPSGGAVVTGAGPIGTFFGGYQSWVPDYSVVLTGMNIEGCTIVGGQAYTCGAGAYISFTNSYAAIWEASEINAAYILTSGRNSNGDMNQQQCWSDPSELTPPNPPNNPSCEMLQSTVAPEPVSVALLATGLLGVGAARRRRRTS